MSSNLDLEALVASLRISPDLPRLENLNFIPVAIPTLDDISEYFGDNVRGVTPTPNELRDATNNLVSVELRYTCHANVRTHLLLPSGEPLKARELYWRYERIGWRAGGGWPGYNTPCPRGDTNSAMLFPSARVHQLVPQFGGNYWTGCDNPGSARGTTTTDVFFSVNDNIYGDNEGTFDVIVVGFA
jgi:hypothetical protein